MEFSNRNSCHRPKRIRARFRYLDFFILLNAVLITTCSVMAEPFVNFLPNQKLMMIVVRLRFYLFIKYMMRFQVIFYCPIV